MIISVKNDTFNNIFNGEEYLINLERKFEGYEKGDLVISGNPFSSDLFPLSLQLAIRINGDIIFRSWSFSTSANSYFHTNEKSEKNCNEFAPAFKATPEQIDIINGLFSGRITYEGLKIAIGDSIQHICPINIKKEEKLTGNKIYLA